MNRWRFFIKLGVIRRGFGQTSLTNSKVRISSINFYSIRHSAFNFECHLIGFPRQVTGIQSEEFKAFPLYTLLVERQKTKQTKTNKQSTKCCLENRITYFHCHLKTI